LNASFASNLIPHSDVITPFYIECLKNFHDYSDKNDFVFGNISTKIFYSYLHSINKCLNVSTWLQKVHLLDL
jgi:hypothetical protein